VSNEIEIVVHAKDETSAGMRSVNETATKTKRSLDDVGESTDRMATASSTATGAFGALSSGIDLANLKAQKRIDHLDRDNAKSDIQIGKLQDQKAKIEAEGKARGLNSDQIAKQTKSIDAQISKLEDEKKGREDQIHALEDQQQKTAGLQTALMGAALATDAFSGVTDLLTLALKGGLVSGLKGAATAVKGFTLSLLTNPVFLIGAAIAALVVGLVVLYKKSETARNIMNTAFSVIGQSVITMAQVGLKGFQFLVNAALTAAGALLNIAAKIPGPQQDAMKKAAAAFGGFKDSVNNSLDAASRKLDDWKGDLARMPKVAKLNGDISDLTEKLNTAKAKLHDKSLTATQTAAVKADIRQLEQKIASAKAQLASIKGKTVTITYKANGIIRTQDSNALGSAGRTHTGGTIRGFAGGGNPPPGMSWVGETGPELLELSGGTARVHPAGNSTRMAAQGGSSGGRGAVLVVGAPGGDRFQDLFIEMIRNFVRVQGGGDVQTALGRS